VDTYAVNVMGTVNVLEAVRTLGTVRSVVCVTSDKCYENHETGQAYREDDAMGGHDPYSSSKGCAELVVAAYRRSFFNPVNQASHGVGVASVRAGNVIGGGDWSDDRLIPDLVRSAVDRRSVSIRYPHATRPWQHVLEPLAGYLLLGQHLHTDPHDAGEAWNFGPDAAGELSVGEVVARFSAQWPAVRCEVDAAPQPHEAALLHLDCRKSRTRLGWRPVWDSATTFERTARWYRQLHEHGALHSLDDLHGYVADARAASLVWAA
jgi:CDP-glucose 4,6-dehydratase